MKTKWLIYRIILSLMMGTLLLASACAPTATPAPPASKATPVPTPEAAPTPEVAQAPRATPAPEPGPAPARPAWQAEWETTLAEARKEGKVAIYGPPASDVRNALTQVFEKSYPGIRVEFTPMPGGSAVPKIEAERRGGVYLVDLVIGGAGPAILLKGFAVPIEQFLVLPEVKDGKYWEGDKLEFSDTERQLAIVFGYAAKTPVAFNTNLVDPEKLGLQSYWDLVKPEWKGKISMPDPRQPGPGQATANFIYGNPQLGPDYFRALAKNEVILSRDTRLLLEWVGRGKYSLTLSPETLVMTELVRAGMPLKSMGALKEGTYTTVGFGSVIYLDKAPHPNAAKVYLNWLLSREGQTAYSKGAGYPVRRRDVPREHLQPEILHQPGVKYTPDYTEEAINRRPAAIKLVQELWGK